MIDETEQYRRARQAQLNSEAAERAKLEEQYGRVWNTEELRQEFEVVGFMAPIVVVRVIATKANGSLEFQHSPRFYFNFQED